MPEARQLCADVSIHGPQTRLQGVKAAKVDYRPWIASFPGCRILNQYQIAQVGLMEAVAPYEIVRSNQTSTYFLACYGGRGRVLIDGRWRDCRAGMACLLPARILNALRAGPKVEWQFCWVCYVQPPDQRPISDSASPVLARYDHVPLQSAILGLMHECQSRAAPAILQRWVELIQEYVLRFAKPATQDRRLLKLWKRVTAQLGGDWTLARLARKGGYSREHLRRLCHLEIGRSPMHQVIYLRMRRAAELLATTKEKVDTLARVVGYENPFVFSKAFHKWVGWRPSDYRGNRRVGTGLASRERPPAMAGDRPRHLLLSAALLACTLAAFPAGERLLLPGNLDAESPAVARAAATPGLSGAPSNLSFTDAEQQDRALREEQLNAARQLHAEYPRAADAVYVAGFVSNEQGDSASAIRSWEEAVRLESDGVRLYDRADACYNLGYAYLLREEYGKAVPFLRESLRLNPRRPETHFRLAHALFLEGKMEESLRVLDDGKVETPLAYRLRGQANQQLGKLEEAKRNYEKAVRLNPNFAEAYYGLATTCTRLGETTKADEYRQKFDALKSEGQAMGRQARTDFNPLAITRRSLAQTHTEVGRVYVAQGQPQKAEKLFLRAAEVDPDNTACRFQLVMLYQQAQRNQEALRFSQEMVRAEPRNAFHYLGMGNLHLRLKQGTEAEAAFKKVIELAPERAEGYFALAQMYVQANLHPAEALQLAQRAVSLAPSPVNYYVLSQACARNGDLPAATAAIEKACELDPRNPQYQRWRVSLRTKQ
jgi:tetratricopeptide (TPR) repeat protein/AraC-like DNA-binding protein